MQKFNSDLSISLKNPGKEVQLPKYIIDQLRQLHPKFKKYLSFFGGHPVSITKLSCNQIFQETCIIDNTLASPYLVCQKTDGVRYILILAHINIDQIQSQNRSNKCSTQCYLVSRQGQKNLVAYAAELQIGQGWMRRKTGQFQHIIQILDGELIIDTFQKRKVQKYKYLIFDALVHMGTNITKMPLYDRLSQINRFLECNKFLLNTSLKNDDQNENNETRLKNKIEIQLKDFFRLTCAKYNSTIDFLLKKYIKCLPHENDGLIFNHQSKQYLFGMNQGYIKWKPAHLNTLDFMIVPNTNLSQKFGNKVLDLYLGSSDNQISGNYIRNFYNFTIVSEDQFAKIQQAYSKRQDQAYENALNQKQQNVQINHFSGAIIAECTFEDTKQEQKQIFRQLFSLSKSPQDIYCDIMKPFNEQKQIEIIKNLQKIVYDKAWKIYKIRSDKGLPNNSQIAKRIEQSIKDNINQAELVKRNQDLNNKCRQGRR